MSRTPKPFARFEFMIAWRYLRAKRAEGGVSVMTVISFLGIMLAVAALIITLGVRTGFRNDFVGIILGANPHASVVALSQPDRRERVLVDYEETAARVSAVEGVTHAFPVIQGQVLAAAQGRNAGVQVTGITAENLRQIPLIANPEIARGTLEDFGQGIAIGSGVARQLGVDVGDRVRLISPDGARTAFGTSPRINAYDVVYIFQVGRFDIDRIRVYMPFEEAQLYFNRDGVADEIEITVEAPEEVDDMILDLARAAGSGGYIWTWQDQSGAYLQALQMEDNVMFIILSVLVLIATMNIVSGLIMLVKNKSRDIGILRTMGLSEGSVLRVFFVCGASIGTAGTVAGVLLGCAFVIWIDPIFDFVNFLAGGGVWDPSVRMLSRLPAELVFADVLSAVSLSMGLSLVITYFPARRAARMNPVEALRYE